jgi:hypothetical protein
MDDISNTLWMVWLCYWASAALVGSFVGTMLAFGIRALWRLVIKLIRKRRV